DECCGRYVANDVERCAAHIQYSVNAEYYGDKGRVDTDHCKNTDNKGNRTARDAGRSDAAEDRHINDHKLNAEREVYARKLCQEEHGYAFVKGSSVLVRSCPDPKHKAVYLFRNAEVFMRNAKSGGQCRIRRRCRKSRNDDCTNSFEKF